jgi:outer membrane protein assembly factor BamB
MVRSLRRGTNLCALLTASLSRPLSYALIAGGVTLLAACGSTPQPKAVLQTIQPALSVKQAWSTDIGKARQANLQPVLVGAAVFAADSGAVYRFDAESGKRVWVADVKDISAGVGADAQVAVVATRKGEVVALESSSGKVLWRTQVGSEIIQTPAVGQGLVVVRGQDNRISAYEASTGKRRWTYQKQIPALILRTAAGMLVTDGGVYAGLPGGRLVALTLNNGSPKWEVAVTFPKGTTELERVADVVGAPVLQGRAVCAVAYQGRLACFDSVTGQQEWTRDISSATGLTADARYVFVGDEKSVVHGFARAGGASLWRNDKLLYRDLSAPLSYASAVVVGDSEGYVHWLGREDGALLARMRADSYAIKAQPIPTPFGVLVQTTGGTLVSYVFQ